MLILPKELISFRKVGKKISLDLATENDIGEILQIWNESKGLTLREIRRKISEIEGFSNYKLLRGISYILSKLSDLGVAEENADRIREFLFSFGPVLDERRKEEVMLSAEKRFGFKILSEKMWGDLDSFRIFQGLKRNITSVELARLYNLALILGASSNCTRVRLRTSKNVRNLLYYIKKLGLMYDVDKGEITVFGPESIIKNSQRYGLAFAKLINKILKHKDFEFSLELPQGTINLSSSDIYHLISTEEGEEEFDSSYEGDFFKLVREVFPSVKVLREPEADESEAGVFIPDFKLILGEKNIFVEIVGFWTPEYLLRKAEKLKRFKKKILLIASEKFTLSQLNPTEQNINVINNPNISIITFKRELPYLEIIKFLKSNLEAEGKTEKVQKKVLIPQHTLGSLSSKLYDGMDIQLAKETIALETDADFKEVLKHLNYYIEWTSLVPPSGKIKKRE